MAAAITSIDFSVLYWIQVHLRTAVLDVFFPLITKLGNSGFFWIILGIVLLCIRKTRVCGICVLVCLAVDAVIGEVILKHIFCRIRPCVVRPISDMLISTPSTYSFPSGHSASSFTAATAIFFHSRHAGTAAYVLAALIAFSRLYCYVHFPSDVIAGMLLGICVAAILTPRMQRFFDSHSFDSRSKEI